MTGPELLHHLPGSLFWDVDMSRLDADRDEIFIIARVMDRGTRPDVDLVWSYYGDQRIQRGVLEAPRLERRTLSYFSHLFGLAPSAFKSFARIQHGQAWRE